MADDFELNDEAARQAIDKLAGDLKADRAANNAFCDCWPCARRILTLLKSVVPQKVAAVIDFLIKIGDGVAASVCKSR
jgi:hypothetical protein